MNLQEPRTVEDISCPLGCPRNDQIAYTGNDLLHGLAGSFTVVKCRTCDLMRTNPRAQDFSIDRAAERYLELLFSQTSSGART